MIVRYIDSLESRGSNAATTNYYFRVFMAAARGKNGRRHSSLESRATRRRRGRSTLPTVRTQDDLASLTDVLFGRTPSPVAGTRRNDLASHGRRRSAMAVRTQGDLEKLTRDLMTV